MKCLNYYGLKICFNLNMNITLTATFRIKPIISENINFKIFLLNDKMSSNQLYLLNNLNKLSFISEHYSNFCILIYTIFIDNYSIPIFLNIIYMLYYYHANHQLQLFSTKSLRILQTSITGFDICVSSVMFVAATGLLF